ncbi:MAG: hypothetical protein KF850_34195 [Labilithrix sp.]|nr:hypothetical protein [Labilithrix sp.]
MFCPKCGKRMDVMNGTFACVSGEMPLSPHLHSNLCELFVSRSRNAHSVPLNWGGSWFCPGRGRAATTGHKHVQCEACGVYLDEFLHALVELHPHRVPDGKGWI